MESTIPPPNWPSSIEYLSRPVHSNKLTPSQTLHLTTKPDSHLSDATPPPTVPVPVPQPQHVRVQKVNDPSHPAHTQHGLFATRHLAPNTLVVPYLGLTHSNAAADTDATSNYDLSLDREAGISVDANRMGNEARMTNDYRGVPRIASQKGPNAEFRDLWFDDGHGRGERGIGIVVLGPGKSGKWKEGIKAGEEILVNYGKGFWKERGG